ncbi:MAG: DUF5684 domain-containing protein [Oscillospiraceae bacterium]
MGPYFAPEAAIIFSTLFAWIMCFSFVSIAALVVTVVAQWYVFEKAGKPGWASLIPFYRSYVLYEITWGEGVMFLFTLIPVANVVFSILTNIKLAKAFGKSTAFAVGLVFLYPIFLCMIGFDKASAYFGVPSSNGGFEPSSNGQGSYQDPYGRPNGGAQQAQGAYQQQSAQNENYYYQQTQQAPSQEEASESAEQSAKPETGNPEQPPTAEVKYCPNCGEPLEHNEKFCPKCGTKQNVTSE